MVPASCADIAYATSVEELTTLRSCSECEPGMLKELLESLLHLLQYGSSYDPDPEDSLVGLLEAIYVRWHSNPLWLLVTVHMTPCAGV